MPTQPNSRSCSKKYWRSEAHKKDAGSSASFLWIKETVDEAQRFGFVGDPMDIFVALEPRHLPFCVVYDFGCECFDYCFFGDYAAEMSADPTIFEAEIVKTFPADALGTQACDFRKHACLNALAQARVDKTMQCLWRSCDTDQKGFVWRCGCERWNGGAGSEDYFKCADQASPVMAIDGKCAIRIELLKLYSERFGGLLLKLVAEFWLWRYGGDDVLVDDGIDIESGSTTKNGNVIALDCVADRAFGETLIARNGKGAFWRRNIEQVMGNTAHFLLCNLTRPEIKAGIYLSGIGGYDFCTGRFAG